MATLLDGPHDPSPLRCRPQNVVAAVLRIDLPGQIAQPLQCAHLPTDRGSIENEMVGHLGRLTAVAFDDQVGAVLLMVAAGYERRNSPTPAAPECAARSVEAEAEAVVGV